MATAGSTTAEISHKPLYTMVSASPLARTSHQAGDDFRRMRAAHSGGNSTGNSTWVTGSLP